MIMSDNFICNNCAGGFLYNELHLQYKNPFIWSIIFPNDYKLLIKEYYNIDFSNYKLDKNDSMYFINIDNMLNIFYPHYKYDELSLRPNKIDNDIFYRDIEEYIIQKYNDRLSRMISEPIFMLCRHSSYGKLVYQKNDFIDIIKNNKDKKILLFSEYDFPKEITDSTLRNVKIDSGHFKSHKIAEVAKNILENEFNIK